MDITKEFIEKSQKAFEDDTQKLFIRKERNEAVIQFCKYILEQMEKENGKTKETGISQTS